MKYECRGRQSVLIEIVTRPKCSVQSDGGFYWHWEARIVQTGEVIEYGISEDAPEYGPHLFRNDSNEVDYGFGYGYEFAEPLLPPYGEKGIIKSIISEVRKVTNKFS